MKPFFTSNMSVLDNGAIVFLVDEIMTEDERAAEIERLEAKLASSEHKEGMAQRVEAIKARLEELRNAD